MAKKTLSLVELKKTSRLMPIEEKKMKKEKQPKGLPAIEKVAEEITQEAIPSKLDEEIVEEMNFLKGQDVVSIKFMVTKGRLYKIKTYLNDTEVRPVTYSGSNSGKAFWNLLKRSMKG